MRVTKFGHACVRIEHDGHTLVIDPGGFTDREAVDGADAVLVTHEHADHLDLGNLSAAEAPIFTIDAVARQITAGDAALTERVTVVTPGDALEVAGLPVRVVGQLHAVIHPELQRFDNSGYLVTAGDQALFHPGDAFTVPDEHVDVLCLPVCAPWSKMSEVMDYARAVAAQRTLAIHDMIYTEFALALVDGRVTDFVARTGGTYARLKPGQDL